MRAADRGFLGHDEPASTHVVEAVEISVSDAPWPFAIEARREIDAYWSAAVARQPALFNGTMLVTSGPRIVDGRLVGEALKVDYASFLYWRDHGFPDRSVANLFGSALIRAADGPLLLGVMADWTSNAGLIYPVGGSLGLDDVQASRVDMAGSIARELAEETGLAVAEAQAASSYVAVFSGARVSVGQRLDFPQTSDALAARIHSFIAAELRPELSDIHVVRGLNEVPPVRILAFAEAHIRHAFA